MKAVKFALTAILASGAVLSAQEGTPRYEVGLNYSWLHVNSANDDRQRTGNGGSGSFVYNINNMVGLVADFGGYANTRINDTLLTYRFGPRFSWRHGRLTLTRSSCSGVRTSGTISIPARSRRTRSPRRLEVV